MPVPWGRADRHDRLLWAHERESGPIGRRRRVGDEALHGRIRPWAEVRTVFGVPAERRAGVDSSRPCPLGRDILTGALRGEVGAVYQAETGTCGGLNFLLLTFCWLTFLPRSSLRRCRSVPLPPPLAL